MGMFDRLSKAWNAFTNSQKPNQDVITSAGARTSQIPHIQRRRYTSERSIISSILTRISIDVSGIKIRHVKIDKDDRYIDDIDGSLNERLNFEPNLDQGPRAFMQDIVMTMLDKGSMAIVPVDVSMTSDGKVSNYLSFRVGEIKEFYPSHVKVSVYNDRKGYREDILLEKQFVAIVYNPLYSVINEPNSTLQRLITKLSLLDEVDAASSANRLDLIIQLPYVVKTDAKRQQAEQRREEIEFQLKSSQYGIAYTDGTEKITQLNRPAENNLLKQIEYLTNTLYDQLGITKDVMSGTASESVMLNYWSRTIEPILDAIVESMQTSFLGLSGIRDGERIRYFKDPFKLVPLSEIAVIADKFSRNEILSANEIRSFMGISPSKDPKADELRNSNMPLTEDPSEDLGKDNQNGS